MSTRKGGVAWSDRTRFLGLRLLSAGVLSERKTFAQPQPADPPAAASDYAVDISMSDEPQNAAEAQIQPALAPWRNGRAAWP